MAYQDQQRVEGFRRKRTTEPSLVSTSPLRSTEKWPNRYLQGAQSLMVPLVENPQGELQMSRRVHPDDSL